MTVFAMHVERAMFGFSVMFELGKTRLTFETLRPKLTRWKGMNHRGRYDRNLHLYLPILHVQLDLWLKKNACGSRSSTERRSADDRHHHRHHRVA